MKAPTNKTDFYRRWMKGEFGNKPKSWANAQAYLDDRGKLFGIVNAMPREIGKPIYVNIPFHDILVKAEDNNSLVFLEPTPTHRTVFHGDLMIASDGQVYLLYSTKVGTRRSALKDESISVYGSTALAFLRHHLWPSDYEEMMLLLERYEDGIIEFSTFSCAVGEIPNRNTIIWEVRNY